MKSVHDILAVLGLLRITLRSFDPTVLLSATAPAISSNSTQSGSISSIFSLLLSTTQSNSALFSTVKYRSVAVAGMSDIRYIPASKPPLSVSTSTSFTIVPSLSVIMLPTKPLPGTLGNLTLPYPPTATWTTA